MPVSARASCVFVQFGVPDEFGHVGGREGGEGEEVVVLLCATAQRLCE